MSTIKTTSNSPAPGAINSGIELQPKVMAQAVTIKRGGSDGSGYETRDGIVTAGHLVLAFFGKTSSNSSPEEQFQFLNELKDKGYIKFVSNIFLPTNTENARLDGAVLLTRKFMNSTDWRKFGFVKKVMRDKNVGVGYQISPPPIPLTKEFLEQLRFRAANNSGDINGPNPPGNSGSQQTARGKKPSEPGKLYLTLISEDGAGRQIYVPNGSGPNYEFVLVWDPNSKTFTQERITPFVPKSAN